MHNRPRSITVISWLFIAVGCIGLVAALRPLMGAAAPRAITPTEAEPLIDVVFALASSLVAAIGGMFMLYGLNWARWLLVAWMGFHIVLSALHSLSELFVHSLLFAVILYVLFRPRATAYFRGMRAVPP